MNKDLLRLRAPKACGFAAPELDAPLRVEHHGGNHQAGIIRGFSVAKVGEAKGHGASLDSTTIDQIVALGQAAPRGVKARFGHPKMSAESFGTLLGRACNYRRDGDMARADLHLDPTAHATPNGNLAAYVLDLAENDPDAFGASIAFSGTREAVLDQDGKPNKDIPPVFRIKRLHATDIVDDPAATDGLFGADELSIALMHPNSRLIACAEQLSVEDRAFLARLLDAPETLDRVRAFLRGEDPIETTEKEDIAMAMTGNTGATPPAAVPAAGATPPQAAQELATKTEAQLSEAQIRADLQRQLDETKKDLEAVKAQQAETARLARLQADCNSFAELVRLGKSLPYLEQEELAVLASLTDAQRGPYLELRKKLGDSWPVGRMIPAELSVPGAAAQEEADYQRLSAMNKSADAPASSKLVGASK